MLRNVVEAVGLLMVVGFLYLCWPPLALLGGGAVCVTWANMTKPNQGQLVRAVGAALGAAKKAWQQAAAEAARRAQQ